MENNKPNNDTFRKVKPEYPIEEPHYHEPEEQKSKSGGRCIFLFMGFVITGLSGVGAVISVIV